MSSRKNPDFTGIFTALVDTVEDVANGLTGPHLRIMLACAACQAGDPSDPRTHDHSRCRAVTGHRIAEALWNILDEAQSNGPSPTGRITTALAVIHEALGTEAELRRSAGWR